MESGKSRALRKKVAIVTSTVLVVALLLTGTYAWYTNSKALNEFSNTGSSSGTPQDNAHLHDDFDKNHSHQPKVPKDVYVENVSTSDSIYVRVQLQEYMDTSTSTAPATVPWQTYKPVGNSDGTINDAANTDTSVQNKLIHAAPTTGLGVTWVFGGTKYYLPNTPLYTDPRTGATYQYVQDNNTYTATTPGAKQTLTPSTPNVISSSVWDTYTAAQQASYVGWIYDVADGWAYWSQPLAPGTATSLLLSEVDFSQSLLDSTYYYAINVNMEAVNFSDLNMWGTGAPSVDNSSQSTTQANDKKIIEYLQSKDPGGSSSSSSAAAALDRIAITGTPATTAYTAGQSFNPAGLTVTAYDTNGNATVLSLSDPGLTFSPSPLTAGTTSVTASYTKNGVTKTAQVPVSITVNPATAALDHIAITGTPATTTYTAGQSFNPAGLTVTAYDTNGNATVLSLSDPNLTFSPNPLTQGTTAVTASYTLNSVTKTAQVPVSITVNPATQTLGNISVSGTPAAQTVGQPFNPSGLTVTATDTSGNPMTVNPSGLTYTFEPSGGANAASGDNAVTVSYTANGATKTANVSPVTVNPAAPGVLSVLTNTFEPDASTSAYVSAMDLIDASSGTIQFDTTNNPLAQCYGYIPLSTFLSNTSGVTIASVNGLPAGTGSITIGQGVDLSNRVTNGASAVAGTNLSGQNCIIIQWLPTAMTGFTANPQSDGDYYKDITFTLSQNGQTSDPITVRLIVSGFIPLTMQP